MNDLFKRTISGIIGILLLLFVVKKGSLFLSLSIFILSLMALKEIFDAFKKIDIVPLEKVGYLIATGIFLTNIYKVITIGFIITLGITALLLTTVFKKEITIESIGITILSVIYIPYLFNHINYLGGTKYIWLIFIIAFATDTFAYITGNLVGKRKLCPEISPNKTVEGFLGGIFGSLIFSIMYSNYVNITPVWKVAVLSIMASVTAQLGDLVASKIKRITKIKDYGFIMPGHGGVLDRFDSIIFSAPLVYYYIKYFLI